MSLGGSQCSSRRLFVKSALAFAGVAVVGARVAQPAMADGSVGVILTDSAPLFTHPSDLSVITHMSAGTPVDILYGPHQDLYEIRYNGTDGWAWVSDVSTDGSVSAGAPAASESETSSTTAASTSVAEPGERWISVNRSAGTVSLMIGDVSQATFGASMGYDASDGGYFSTAIGTYYVYQFDGSLHYTDFAKAYITSWVGFDPGRFNGFHSYSKDSKGNILPNGSGRTGGCVALAEGDIDAVYAFAEMGMRVKVHY